MAERTGAGEDELCRRKRALAEAYLEAQNEEEYRRWKLYADISCMRADQERRYPSIMIDENLIGPAP